MDEMMNKVQQTPEELALQADLQRQVEAMIERDKLDPRQQMYMVNVTTGRLIKTNEMYHKAMENRDPIRKVTYDQAMALYKQEKAVKAQALANVAKRKRAKQARKKNR